MLRIGINKSQKEIALAISIFVGVFIISSYIVAAEYSCMWYSNERCHNIAGCMADEIVVYPFCILECISDEVTAQVVCSTYYFC